MGMGFVGMDGAGVNAELDAFNAFALLPFEMHVEVADLQFGEFPFEGGRVDSEIAQGPHGHVAANTGRTVEK